MALFPADVGAALGVHRGSVDPGTFGPDLRDVTFYFYWSGLVLNYVVLPAAALVLESGGHGPKARAYDAGIKIAKKLAVLALVGIIFTLIFVFANGWDGNALASLKDSAIALANTLGLIQITFLLG